MLTAGNSIECNIPSGDDDDIDVDGEDDNDDNGYVNNIAYQKHSIAQNLSVVT